MEFLGNLYYIKEFNAESKTYQIGFKKDSSIFAGHFPGYPVLPGVCLIKIVAGLLEQFLGRKVRLKSVVNAKFLNLITPEAEPEIRFTLPQTPMEGSALKVSAHIYTGGLSYAKLSLLFEFQ